MSCPRCGSNDIVILSSETLSFKCRKCGYVWNVEQKIATVNTPSGPVHWTVHTYYKELALQDSIDLLKEGKDINEIVEELKRRYSNYLNDSEIRKIVEKAVKLSQYY